VIIFFAIFQKRLFFWENMAKGSRPLPGIRGILGMRERRISRISRISRIQGIRGMAWRTLARD